MFEQKVSLNRLGDERFGPLETLKIEVIDLLIVEFLLGKILLVEGRLEDDLRLQRLFLLDEGALEGESNVVVFVAFDNVATDAVVILVAQKL